MDFMAEILRQPWWLVAWVFWLILANSASVFFLRRIEARWVLAVWIGNAIFMTLLYERVGYVRLLGLSHVLFWTPLLAYLYRRRDEIPAAGAYGRWLRILFVTNALSLVVDYLDVVRYLLGDRV